MNQHLILYNSTHGQTRKICSFIADEMLKKQLSATVMHIDSALKNLNLSEYSSVLFGMPVRYGKHDKRMIRFINLNSDSLGKIKTGIFSVNLTARKEDKNTPENNPYMRKLLNEIPLKPDISAVMAGALKYTEYRWVDRIMIRLIMKLTKGPTDTSINTEFTCWKQVESFSKRYIQILSPGQENPD